jgi:hypothetical protein
VGYAVTSGLHAGGSRLQKLLLAPAVGLAVTVICLFGLSRLGLPVSAFAIPLAVLILLGAALLLWRTRPGVDWRRAWPYGVVLAFALVATGRPMFQYGFDWVSYCNDDMANYALAADWFYHHGYYDLPRADEIIQGRHYSADYWFLYHGMKSRPGCELVLAWVSRCTGLTAHQVFMPVILAFHLGLLLAAAALAANRGLEEKAPEGVPLDLDEVDRSDETPVPSPLYSGETRADSAAARERVRVRGGVREECGSTTGAARARPLTPALSPEYRGEGVRPSPKSRLLSTIRDTEQSSSTTHADRRTRLSSSPRTDRPDADDGPGGVAAAALPAGGPVGGA